MDAELSSLIRKLGPRWFLVRDVRATRNTGLLQPRCRPYPTCAAP